MPVGVRFIKTFSNSRGRLNPARSKLVALDCCERSYLILSWAVSLDQNFMKHADNQDRHTVL